MNLKTLNKEEEKEDGTLTFAPYGKMCAVW
jgi:hypothetical protein